jgi:hypothetical protein
MRIAWKSIPPQGKSVLDAGQGDSRAAAVPVDPWVAAAHTFAGRDSINDMQMLADFRNLAPPAHLKQNLLTVNRTTAVKAAVADYDSVRPCDPTMEVPVVPQWVLGVLPRFHGDSVQHSSGYYPEEHGP